MTSVYGVTFVGARKQIQNVLGDRILKQTEGSEVREFSSAVRLVWTPVMCGYENKHYEE